MNKLVKAFDGIHLQSTPEKNLHRIDAHMTFTMGEQLIDHVAYNHWHKQKGAYTQCYLSKVAIRWFLRLHESYKNDWSAFVSAFKKQFSSQKTACFAQVESQAFRRKENGNVNH